MRNINIIVNDLGFFDANFVDYIDAFNPEDFLSLDRIQMAGAEIVPPLLRALDEQGLQAVISHDLTTVAKLHRASGGRMKRLIQPNDPRYHPHASPADTVVLALLRDGLPQGCVASRLIWCEGTLANEMESGRFWVENPATMWTRSDRCIVRAPIAKTIRSSYVVFSGALAFVRLGLVLVDRDLRRCGGPPASFRRLWVAFDGFGNLAYAAWRGRRAAQIRVVVDRSRNRDGIVAAAGDRGSRAHDGTAAHVRSCFRRPAHRSGDVSSLSRWSGPVMLERFGAPERRAPR